MRVRWNHSANTTNGTPVTRAEFLRSRSAAGPTRRQERGDQRGNGRLGGDAQAPLRVAERELPDGRTGAVVGEAMIMQTINQGTTEDALRLIDESHAQLLDDRPHPSGPSKRRSVDQQAQRLGERQYSANACASGVGARPGRASGSGRRSTPCWPTCPLRPIGRSLSRSAHLRVRWSLHPSEAAKTP